VSEERIEAKEKRRCKILRRERARHKTLPCESVIGVASPREKRKTIPGKKGKTRKRKQKNSAFGIAGGRALRVASKRGGRALPNRGVQE